MSAPFSRFAVSVLLLSTASAFSSSAWADIQMRMDTTFGEPIPLATDDDSGLAFCHTEKWSKACLFGLMVYRCEQYAFPLPAVGCAAGASAFSEMIDMQRIPIKADDGNTYLLPVIFTTKLVSMIQEPRIQSDLRDLLGLLDYYSKQKKKFDLWEWVRATNQGDLEKTFEWFAVLLQDTSAIQIQIAYLDEEAKKGKFSMPTKRAIDDLADLSTFLSNANLVKLKYSEWLRLYPQTKKLDEELTPLVYHFYPMSYLAVKLKNLGLGARLSGFLPFLFNTEYELQYLDPEMWPLRHPRPEKIDLKSEYVRWKMRDIYGGLTGSLWAVGKISTAPGLETFLTTYAKSPYRTMQSYYWSFGR